ncbi:MAG TPA: M23 family metallopeptidase, partial [Roseiflexaceae bacterium]|nr:M23 family metallopeptidase [Roseiflexaceae bacterium]
SLDLVSAEGRTAGATVRAAATGTVFIWVRRSGTLILDHGGGFYTMYTHMASAAVTEEGRMVSRGEAIGTVGDRGAPGTPHLHFTAFTAEGAYARSRRSVPLAFAEGYDLPEVGGCSQHGGATLVAGSSPVLRSEGIAFQSPAEPGHWYNSDLRVEFGGAGIAGGFSSAWDGDPAGGAPAVAGQPLGAAQLASAGEGLHTLYVRGWDAAGNQVVSSFGPLGFDVTPPGAPPRLDEDELVIPAGRPAQLSWRPAQDSASGVAGYRVYLGQDPQGISEWFVPVPEVQAPPLAPGSYLLRLQPLDYAGNAGEWVTVGTLLVGG